MGVKGGSGLWIMEGDGEREGGGWEGTGSRLFLCAWLSGS